MEKLKRGRITSPEGESEKPNSKFRNMGESVQSTSDINSALLECSPTANTSNCTAMSTAGGDQTSSVVLSPGSSVFPPPADQDTINLLKELKQGQSLIKRTFESKIDKLRKEITALITEKISSLREEMTLEMANLNIWNLN